VTTLTEPQPKTETSEIECMKQARIRRLLNELNANSISRSGIEEELRELGYDLKKRRA
jgi:hypothetical protein